MRTAAPPQNETGRAFARPESMNLSTVNAQRRKRVNAGGLRAWLEVAGSLVELGRRDPERAARYLVTWSARIVRATGNQGEVRGVLASGGNTR